MSEVSNGAQQAVAAYERLVQLLEAQLQRGSPWSRDRNLRLERIELLVDELQKPQLRYPSVHVGGTSGKGTVSATTAAILSAHGRQTGLHLSPYVQTLTESWQLDGRHVDPARMFDVVRRVAAAADVIADGQYGRPSYFEVKTAAAFQLFADENVDAAVIEVGLGGTLDATNVLSRGVKVLTNVGLDHTEVLGETVEVIASDKVGIFRPESIVISGAEQPSVREIVARRAAEVGSRLYMLDAALWVKRSGNRLDVQVDRDWALSISVPRDWPDFQFRNAALAISAAWATLGQLDAERVQAALASVALPGRFELFATNGRTIVLDGAHNMDKLKATLSRVRARFPGQPLAAVLALKEGKDVTGIMAAAAPLFDGIVVTRFEVAQWRSVDPDRLRQALNEAAFSGWLVVEPDPRAALEEVLQRTKEGSVVVVTGSLYLVGAVREHYRPLADELLGGGAYPGLSR